MIKAAAIRLSNGVIHAGYRHADIIKSLANKGTDRKVVRTAMQGFILTSGYFVNRKDAMLIAKEAGQVPETFPNDTLYSEDIFHPDGKAIQYKEDIA